MPAVIAKAAETSGDHQTRSLARSALQTGRPVSVGAAGTNSVCADAMAGFLSERVPMATEWLLAFLELHGRQQVGHAGHALSRCRREGYTRGHFAGRVLLIGAMEPRGAQKPLELIDQRAR